MDIERLIGKLRVEAVKGGQRYKMAAAIIRRKRILGIGHNDSGAHTHPKSTHPYGAQHAEFAAILACRGVETRGATCVVLRFNKTGVGNSAPCKMCKDLLSSFGISKVYYVEDGNIKTSRVRDLVPKSRVVRHSDPSRKEVPGHPVETVPKSTVLMYRTR